MPHRQDAPWDRSEFLDQLRSVGQRRYHHRHPFHHRMNLGQLTHEQVRGWVANRFYYQRSIPLKDAAILSNCPLREVRRAWLHRLTDHDGLREGEGGIEAWLRLAEASGLTPYGVEGMLAIFAGSGPCREQPRCEECPLSNRCPSSSIAETSTAFRLD